MTVGISHVAWTKLSTLRRDYLAMDDAERLAFVEALRAKRVRPPAAPKLVKPPKPPTEKKPRKKKEAPVATDNAV